MNTLGEMRVYILSVYEEHGAEEVVATLDKSHVEIMMDKYFSTCGLDETDGPKLGEFRATPRETLRRVLKEDTTGKFNLQDGWGGIQLHVVELEPK